MLLFSGERSAEIRLPIPVTKGIQTGKVFPAPDAEGDGVPPALDLAAALLQQLPQRVQIGGALCKGVVYGRAHLRTWKSKSAAEHRGSTVYAPQPDGGYL